VLGPEAPSEAADEAPEKALETVPAAADPEAVRRQIEEAESGGGRMPGVVPVGEGTLPLGGGPIAPQHVLLGVYLVPVPTGPGLPPPAEGVVVHEVVPGTPAAEAGIRPGDVILSINGQRVGPYGHTKIRDLISGAGAGASVKVTCRRGEETRTVEVVLAGREDSR
jgi:membrane-associated protease RseP (regulator of RpoE activity)